MRPIALLSTSARSEREAVADIVAQSREGTAGFTVLFCCASYDLRKLGQALHAQGRSRVIGAATSRAIGVDGFLNAGITGFHLPGGRFKVADALIEDIRRFGLPDARELVRTLRARLERGHLRSPAGHACDAAGPPGD